MGQLQRMLDARAALAAQVEAPFAAQAQRRHQRLGAQFALVVAVPAHGVLTIAVVVEQHAIERLAEAAAAAAAIDWAGDPWHALTDWLKGTSGRKGKALFLPLRLALTGRAHGPDMGQLLPLIGQARAVARLGAAAG